MHEGAFIHLCIDGELIILLIIKDDRKWSWTISGTMHVVPVGNYKHQANGHVRLCVCVPEWDGLIVLHSTAVPSGPAARCH